MRATDVAHKLARMLEERGVTLEFTEVSTMFGPGSEALTAWECFKHLAAEAATDATSSDGKIASVTADMLLYETLIGDATPSTGWVDPNAPTEPEMFGLTFARQLTLEDDGQYLGMNELGLSFEVPLEADADRLSGEKRWGEAGEASAAWADAVESSEAFTRLVRGGRVTRFVIDQGDI